MNYYIYLPINNSVLFNRICIPHKNMKFIVACILLSFCITSCTNSNNDSNMGQLQLADNYMTTKPEISLKILDSLNNTDCPKDHYFALLYAQAKYRNYARIDNDSLILVALQYYSTCNDSVTKARTYLVAAQVYKELNQYETALKYIHNAATTAKGITDNWLKCHIYYLWGRLLKESSDIDDSTEKFEISLFFAKELKDTSLIINRMNEIGYNYLASKKYITSIEKFNEAIELAASSGHKISLASLYGNKSLAFHLINSNEEALKNISQAILYNKYLHGNDSLSNLNFKGRLLLLCNQIDSAQYYIERGKDTSSIYGMNAYYSCMSTLKEKQKDFKSALEYEKLHSKCLQQIASDIESNKIAELNKQYNSAQIEAENKQLKINNQQKSIFALSATIITIVVALMAYEYTLHHRRKARLALQEQLNSFNNSIKQMQQHENQIMADRLKMHEEAMTLTHNLDDKTRELEAARKLISDMKKHLLQNNAAVKKIYDILHASSNTKKYEKPAPLNESEIDELITAINNCYDNFAEKLRTRFSGLSPGDIYICCLIKLGIDNPGLCAILDISDNTLRKRKYRIKKERLDPNGNYTSLEDMIRAPHPL